MDHLPVFKALRGDNPEQNAGTICASNLEHLPVFKALCGEDPEKNAFAWEGNIHTHIQHKDGHGDY